jgi:SAM-dependent methyltransferase
MLALAEENKRKSGLTNVEFMKGEIENIPLPDNSVDVIISNCVINLSADKDRVLKEAFRVLKPRGRFAISDVVVRGNVPAEIRKSLELWVGCVAGALRDYDYVTKLAKAGFDDIDIEPTRVYGIEDARVPFEEGRFVATHIPGARFVQLETQNHLPLANEPAWHRWMDEFRAFVPATPAGTAQFDALTRRERELVELIEFTANATVGHSIVVATTYYGPSKPTDIRWIAEHFGLRRSPANPSSSIR